MSSTTRATDEVMQKKQQERDEPMAEAVEPRKVRIEIGATAIASKLSHVLAVVVATVIALCVSAVLADGTSVVKLRAVRQLPTYGIGLHHDQSGRSWSHIGAEKTLKQLLADLGATVVGAALPRVIMTDALKHPVALLGCKGLQMSGLAAMSFGFIAETVAVVMVIFHALALAGLLPAAVVKPVAALVWLSLSVGFFAVVLLAVAIYTTNWECDRPIVPWLRISDHFDYNYGFPYAVIGFIASWLVFVVTVFFMGQKASKSVVKAGVSLVVGLIFMGAGVIIVMAATGALNGAGPVDESINPCAGQKPYNSGPGDRYFENTACFKDSVVQTLEQAGGNVTRGYKGGLSAADRVPITKSYESAGLCPVNVHWHLGAEHLSVGEYDDKGSGPASGHHRRLEEGARKGFQCHHYEESDAKFNTPYNWQHCPGMHVGETYEIHWPHSAAGACGTKYQYQTPFDDGVFCKDGIITIAPLNTYEKIGVQAQIFVIVNDDSPEYYYPDLIKGMIVSGDKGTDMAMYTGSTTGTSRDNTHCSRYTPITWQVDRKCHLISASSFDKLCADMKGMADDMSDDLHAHGARELVLHNLTADNQQRRK
ncbi:hypothetical protein AB1Y20_023223 [Prymnesium parvum]|uniref:Uncharacterized protein n=1 Tax=Prymnesium parvum TaxID=97485 RepID=A0AB34JFK8_PRYPA